MNIYTLNFDQLSMQDLEKVGSKNASLGEMINYLSSYNIRIPKGFAITTNAFLEFLSQDGLDKKIYSLLESVDLENINQLKTIGKDIRTMITNLSFPIKLKHEIYESFKKLKKSIGYENFSVAVRSSATAEDLPKASFAGQQETFLNIRGIDEIFIAIKKVFASLFNDRAVSYRIHNGFSHKDIALSVGIQQMIRSDLASSGVIFTIDTESGFDQIILITSSYGLGELIVQGAVDPDEFYVHKLNLKNGKSSIIRKVLGNKINKIIYSNRNKNNHSIKIEKVNFSDRMLFSLQTQEIEQLAKYALIIEEHYKRPMDIEWAKDGIDGKLYILQARPETVKSFSKKKSLERYKILEKSKILTTGKSIGQKIGQGNAKIIRRIEDMYNIKFGDVLVSDMTDPNWEPIMKKVSAIVTNRGGRTCHTAIVARELGIPAVVGCGNATKLIRDGENITVSCAEGNIGYVYQGLIPFKKLYINIKSKLKFPIKIMMNISNPERAFYLHSLPNDGVGLVRLEFLIANTIGIHPKALLNFNKIKNKKLKYIIKNKTAAYISPTEYYIESIKEGIATIASAFYPKPVIVRFSDFKSNEYINLIGGKYYEPIEENPMLGFRGVSRYISKTFRDCFFLECQAIKRVREIMGFTNVEIMIPFVRTILEAKKIISILKKYGLERGKRDLRIIMMCEVPSNFLLANEFLNFFDGFSIGSNDLTQLTLGLDRDSELLSDQFDERNKAIKMLIDMSIYACKKENKYIGICGQGPSDYKDFALWLMKKKIDSISLNPDAILDTYLFLEKFYNFNLK